MVFNKEVKKILEYIKNNDFPLDYYISMTKNDIAFPEVFEDFDLSELRKFHGDMSNEDEHDLLGYLSGDKRYFITSTSFNDDLFILLKTKVNNNVVTVSDQTKDKIGINIKVSSDDTVMIDENKSVSIDSDKRDDISLKSPTDSLYISEKIKNGIVVYLDKDITIYSEVSEFKEMNNGFEFNYVSTQDHQKHHIVFFGKEIKYKFIENK